MKYLLLILFFFNIFSAQNTADFSQIIKNETNYFEGKKAENQEVKIKLDSVFPDAKIQDKYTIVGILEIEKDVFKISGNLSFNAAQTKKLKDPTVTIFDVFFKDENSKQRSNFFIGSLMLKVMPKLFNVIVFEGIYEENEEKFPMYFDNSKQLMKYLETLKNK